MIIADTNIVSEFMRDQPDPTVLAWGASQVAGELTICVVTVEEIERGIGRLPPGRRKDDLRVRWQSLINDFADTIKVYDITAAEATATTLIHAEASGHPMALADAQIAGICLATGSQLATRNVRDFRDVPLLKVVDPFQPRT
ncbi:MAG: type II toxin-antitoxin system VapC family toxin [Propionibacteriaceae bacterium]|nr:type II toxin-antitoxin system VapC family toxin [Micropruina sp.]HBX79686.1 VapC toxin family PIN domain ribonuclease [Propionibacteriaceae bacterium]HBY23692.1 VapC toxin family PIN domain ribonuclease [Propionibacteriaceae bacterium]